MLNDTIAAVATAVANAGISIIRISGSESIDVIDKIFRPKDSNKKIINVKSHTIHYGFIVNNEEVIDEVLVSIMRAPNTFTKEDIVEINCHGGLIVTQKILKLVLKNNVRMAEPGEFTKRGFINGRIDLSQAEAVIDIINSKTDLSLKSSISQLEGSITNIVNNLRNRLIEIMAHIEASIDYPEYDIDELNNDSLLKVIDYVIDKVDKLEKSADNGRILREGLKTVIVGKPNVGKSSFLNALLKEQRAIVTDVAGTTRDTLEEYINIEGIPINIIDTAGIRETEDVVENIGVEKSKEFINKSDLILYLVDNTKELSNEDIKIIDLIKDKKVIILINKSDLKSVVSVDDLKIKLNKPIIKISAKNNYGIDKFELLIKDMFMEGNIDINNDVFITNVRHKNALQKSLVSLKEVVNTINSGLPEDYIAIDLKNAYDALGEIIGVSIEENIIDQIFSQFCLGK